MAVEAVHSDQGRTHRLGHPQPVSTPGTGAAREQAFRVGGDKSADQIRVALEAAIANHNGLGAVLDGLSAAFRDEADDPVFLADQILRPHAALERAAAGLEPCGQVAQHDVRPAAFPVESRPPRTGRRQDETHELHGAALDKLSALRAQPVDGHAGVGRHDRTEATAARAVRQMIDFGKNVRFRRHRILLRDVYDASGPPRVAWVIRSLALLQNQGLQAKLRRPDRRREARDAAADDNQIVCH